MLSGVPLLTGKQMASIDRRAIAGGASGADLMDAAGCAVFDAVREVAGGLRGRSVVVLCGKGNNGGDGFVFARLAQVEGARVSCFLAASADDVVGDALHHLNLLKPHVDVRDAAASQDVMESLSQADVSVDALLGTGLEGPARDPIAEWIRLVDRADCLKVAVDVPSGLNADNGTAEGPCARADATVTFAAPRIGHFHHPGRSLCGRLFLRDIGIRPEVVQAEGISTSVIGLHGIRDLLFVRPADAHKGSCGRVAVIAGSEGMTGAASLTSMAALRSGAGLVTLGTPAGLSDILEVKLTEIMTRPLPDVGKRRCLALRGRGEIQALFQSVDAIAIGPGLGTYRETSELVRRLLQDLTAPTVLDADALNAIAGSVELLREASAPVVITPHVGEFSRLTGRAVADVKSDPIGAARFLAQEIGITVVLKGTPTVVASAEGNTWVNPSGNAGMATAGSGDVLTGLLAGQLAQGLEPVQAACVSVYLHGLAGDLASEWMGEAGMIASDILAHLPEAEQASRSQADVGRYVSVG